MPPSADQFRPYLTLREPVVAASTGTLFETSSWNPVSIGLTDRRLLCVTDSGRVITVDYDAICTIQSRPRTTQTYHGMDHRLLLGGGCLVALLGGLGTVVFSTGVLVPLLALVTVGGLILAEGARRQPDQFGRRTIGQFGRGTIGQFGRGTRAAVTARVPYDIDSTAFGRWTERFVPETVQDHQMLLAGSGVVATVSFISLVLLASSGHVVLGVLMLVGGIALVDYGSRHQSKFDGIEINRHHEIEVSIGTNADRTLHIRSDSSDELLRELNRVPFMEESEANQLVSSLS